jgi:hypothetical protein
MLAVGLGLFEWARRGMVRRWSAVQACIEEQEEAGHQEAVR